MFDSASSKIRAVIAQKSSQKAPHTLTKKQTKRLSKLKDMFVAPVVGKAIKSFDLSEFVSRFE